MKRLFIALIALFVTASVHAASVSMFTLTNNAAIRLLSVQAAVDNLTVYNSSTNAATIRFYDSNAASGAGMTSIVRAAYTSYSTYATNYDVAFTNEYNVIITNTFVGTYTAGTSVSAVTNERPVVAILQVPATTILSQDIKLLPVRGLTALSDQDGVLTVTYRSAQ